MPLITAGAVALEQGICRPGWVEVSGGQIVGCGSGQPPLPADVDMPEALVVPGFVDIHVHGGGGASYTDGNDADIVHAAMFHRSHGTTTTLASLITASRSCAGSCAPQYAALSQGPSRWTPATAPARVESASTRTAVSSSAGGAVTRLATLVVVPCPR